MGSELPATVQARCYAQIGVASTAIADCAEPGSNHGTAVAEASWTWRLAHPCMSPTPPPPPT